MNTQKERLKQHLEKGEKVTGLDAWTKLGIYRLSARIYDLRKDLSIQDKWILVKNQFGEFVKVKECFIAE